MRTLHLKLPWHKVFLLEMVRQHIIPAQFLVAPPYDDRTCKLWLLQDMGTYQKSNYQL
jgi:hypothetical protein